MFQNATKEKRRILIADGGRDSPRLVKSPGDYLVLEENNATKAYRGAMDPKVLMQHQTRRSQPFRCVMPSMHEVRPRKDKRGVDLISDALPFGRLWYGEPNAVANTIGYARFEAVHIDAVFRVYDGAGNVIETHEHAGNFKEW
jgi:hypothetical protein